MYTAHRPRKNKRRTHLAWLLVLLCLVGLGAGGSVYARRALKPTTTVSQSKSVTTHVSYQSALKHYALSDFSIDLPSAWQQAPRPAGPYNMFIWQVSDHGAGGQVITVYEDTIPVNFAVNRALIVESQSDHLALQGSISDNCSTFTGNAAVTPGQFGARAKWQGIDFLCDQANTERDTIGTSSKDGINTVVLRGPSTGQNHKFFFTYSDSAINPDYTVFLNALNSFHMQ